MTVIREYQISEFRGEFPDVPVASGVDVAALKEIDADPLFVTLPVVPEVGAISKNGLLYDEALVNSIEEQINAKRPGAGMGHLKNDERDTAFPLPSGMWVGAKRFGQTLWAKAYVPPGAARDHIKRLKAIGGQIATSIYGTGQFDAVSKGVRRLSNFTLESLDFAPPDRAALGYGAAPLVTAEMETDNEEGQQEMPTKEEILASLTAADVPAQVREQIVQEHTQTTGQAERVQELTDQVTVLETAVAEYRRKENERAIDIRVLELTNWQVKDEAGKAKLESLRRMLRSQMVAEMGSDVTAERITEIAAKVWDELKPIAETVRDALAGPPALVSGKDRGNGAGITPLEDTAENRQKAMSRMGIQI